MFAKDRQTLVHVLAEPANLRRVVRQQRLLPSIGHCFQQSDQTGGCREHDVLPQGFVHEAGIFLQRRRQKLVAGQKEHDEIGTMLELRPILLGR